MGRRSNAKKRRTKAEKLAELIAEIQPSAAVLDLPHYATKSQKQWWNPLIGQPFRDAVATRGKKDDNAVTWVHSIFVNKFCKERYPHLVPEDCEQYYKLIGEKFYQYLTNHTNSGKNGVTAKEATPPKSRAYGYNIWRRDAPEEFERIKSEYLESHPRKKDDVGDRSLMSALFKCLPEAERRRYTNQARDELAAAQALSLLFGNERNQYNESIPRRLRAFMKEVETCSKALINCHLLTEDGDGNFRISSVASSKLKPFQSSQENAKALNAMKDWVQSTANGKDVDGGAPAIAVYTDDLKEGFPRLPNFAGVKLAEAKKLVRVYITMVWMFMGGTSKVPWEEIENDVHKWIESDRMPPGAVWKDPGSLTFAEALVWLDWFMGSQDGTVPLNNRFQFRRVYAGLCPIARDASQEFDRECGQRGEKDSYILHFNETVTRCHQPAGMTYPDPSKAYTEFLLTGNFSGASSPEWHGLPATAVLPTGLIDDNAKAALLEHAKDLPEDASDLVKKLLDALHEHQYHYPASNSAGPWADKSLLPALLPQAVPTDCTAALRDFALDFWVAKCYFHPPSESGNSLISFFETWQHKVLNSGVLHHEPSGTMLGGPFGVVWVVISLIKLVLNFAALRGDIPYPVELPEGCDATRVPLGEWGRLLGWCRNWIAKLERDVEVLKQTSEDRRQSSNNSAAVPSASEPALPPGSLALSQDPATQSTAPEKNPSSKEASKRQSRSLDEGCPEPGSESSDSEEEDYDKKDGGGSDAGSETAKSDTDMGDPDEGWNHQGNDTVPFPEPPAPVLPAPAPVPIPPTPAQPIPHVFGDFPKLAELKKNQKPKLPKSYEQIKSGLTECNEKIERAIRAFYRMGHEHMQLDDEEANAAADRPTSLPPAFRPLLDFVHTAILGWKRSATAAPVIFQHSYEFRMLVRECIPITGASYRYRGLARIQRGIADSDSDSDSDEDEDDDSMRIRGLEAEVNRKLAELRWLHHDLTIFESLSSKWAAKLGTDWPPAETPDDPASLLVLAALLLEWAEATELAEQRAIAAWKIFWQDLDGSRDEACKRAEVPPCYRFGSPSTGAELASLKACLKVASLAVTTPPTPPSDSSRAASVLVIAKDGTSDMPSGVQTPQEMPDIGSTAPDREPALENTTAAPKEPVQNAEGSTMNTDRTNTGASDKHTSPLTRSSTHTTTPTNPSETSTSGERDETVDADMTELTELTVTGKKNKPPASGARGRKSLTSDAPPAAPTASRPSTRSSTKVLEPPAHNTRNGTKRQATGNQGAGRNGGPKRRKT